MECIDWHNVERTTPDLLIPAVKIWESAKAGSAIVPAFPPGVVVTIPMVAHALIKAMVGDLHPRGVVHIVARAHALSTVIGCAPDDVVERQAVGGGVVALDVDRTFFVVGAMHFLNYHAGFNINTFCESLARPSLAGRAWDAVNLRVCQR